METFSALLALCAGNSPVTGEFPAKRPVTRSLMFYLIWAWINGWVNNRKAGDLRGHRAHYDVIVMYQDHDSVTLSEAVRPDHVVNTMSQFMFSLNDNILFLYIHDCDTPALVQGEGHNRDQSLQGLIIPYSITMTQWVPICILYIQTDFLSVRKPSSIETWSCVTLPPPPCIWETGFLMLWK